MNSDIMELYQDLILDHSKHPRNYGHLDQPTNCAKGYNPLCGDSLELELSLKDGVICQARFTGSGCAISVASASVMCECIVGQTVEQLQDVIEAFRQIAMKGEIPVNLPARLEDLAVFSGVSKFPIRIKCATLAWHALKNALEN